MPQGNPKPGEIYRHFKNNDYQVLAIAHHSETDEMLVVYQGMYAPYRVCARPYEMFISEVDRVKYPHVAQTWRFELIGDTTVGIYGPNGARETENAPQDPSEGGAAEAADQKPEIAPETAADAGQAPEIESRPELIAGVSPEAVSDAAEADTDSEPHVNPWLLRFMDADSMEEKYQIFTEMGPEVTDRLIDEI